MKIVILTSVPRGIASLCIPHIVEKPGIELSMIIYSQGQKAHRWKMIKRRIKKVRKIGPLGALVGLRMRPWSKEDLSAFLNIESIDVVANRFGVRLETTPSINCEESVALFRTADADLGISLGNGYIGKRVFSIPKYGMINVHHEVLPDFCGAQSVIWQIHEGSTQTGYTIHQIDEHIDTGNILYRETIPIEFKRTLRETAAFNTARLLEESAKGLVHVLENYLELKEASSSQVGSRFFTTPTFREYLQMKAQHRRLRKKSKD